MKPWMSKEDIKTIEDIMSSYSKRTINVLEWGSGGSTKYFTDFLIKGCIKYSWISLEYNKSWYNKIKALNIKNTQIYLFDSGNNNLFQKNINMDEYVSFPLSLKKRFDIIIVDGRKRRRCLINAAKILNEGGIVLLHDAYRKYYHCAFSNFSNSRFFSKSLWGGYV